MSLTADQIAIIKSTVPILEAGGEALTTHFYTLLMKEDGIKRFFNQGHQAEGSQPRALAFSLLCVAKHIDAIGDLIASPAGTLLINQIVQKHVALHVLPEHYPIVGRNLLRAIREVLGEEVATDAVIKAWEIAYGIVADLLIGIEAAEFEKLAAVPGGWRGLRGFRIINRVQDTPTAVTYTLQSEDKLPVLIPKAGQYLTLDIVDDAAGLSTKRNYSLCDTVQADEDGVHNIYKITTELVPGSCMPHYLAKRQVGDILQVLPPAGQFTLDDASDAPLVFIAAGSGITPFVSMCREAYAAHPSRPITLVHIARSEERQMLKTVTSDLGGVKLVVHHTSAPDSKLYSPESPDQPSAAYLDLLRQVLLKDGEPVVEEKNIYVVGPKHFMINTLTAILQVVPSFDGTAVKFEAFGPHPSFELIAAREAAKKH